MKQNVILLLALVAPLLLTTGPAEARSFRCDNGIASTQDSKAAILHKCREPQLRDTFCREPASAHRRKQTCITVEEWTYNPGPGKFMIRVQFEQGEAVSIDRGERVGG